MLCVWDKRKGRKKMVYDPSEKRKHKRKKQPWVTIRRKVVDTNDQQR